MSAIHDTDQIKIDRLAQNFRSTNGTTGFGYIVNHGIVEDLIDRVFAASALFHALPRDRKTRIELNSLHRGFIPINTSTDVNSKLAAVKRPSQSESFMMIREDGPDSPDVLAGNYLAGANQWPDLDNFREDVTEYHDALTELGRKLMRIAALSVGADPDHSGKERYSCPFFFDPSVTTVVEALPCCIGSGERSMFEPVVFGDFLRRELEAGYDKHQRKDE